MDGEPLWEGDLALAWAPPEQLTVSEWAERNRIIVSKDAAEPGAWSNHRTPYLTEIMDCLGDDEHEEVIIVKAARVGGTEALRNALCFWLAQDPGPVLWVYPTEDSAKEQVKKEIIPLLEEVPALARLKTGRARDLSLSKGEITLTTCNFYSGWAGSAQTLASRTIQRAVGDEIDKFPAFSGRDADPVSLLKRRVVTFGNRGKVVLNSTPTTEEGAIWQAWLRCPDRRHFMFPCPACAALVPPKWDLVRWEAQGNTADEQAAYVEVKNTAWIECPSCEHKITERERVAAVRRGRWVSEVSLPFKSKRVAFHVPALVSSLGVTLGRLVAQFLVAQSRGYGERMEFVTQALGLPYKGDLLGGTKSGIRALREACVGLRRGSVPQWASAVVLCADTQKDGWRWGARAWGVDGRSRLVDYGSVATVEDLVGLLSREWPVAGTMLKVVGSCLLVDAGGGMAVEGEGEEENETTTGLVYRAAQKEPRLIPCLGKDNIEAPFLRMKTNHVYRGSLVARVLYHKPDHFKDDLAAAVALGQGWEITGDTGEDFLVCFENAQKVEKKDGGKTWGRRYKGAVIDFFDVEALSVAGFRLLETGAMPAQRAIEPVIARSVSWLDGRREESWWEGVTWRR